MIKKIFSFFFFSVLVAPVFSQNGKVISAFKYMSDYASSNDINSLKSAKDAIDTAANNPETANDAKTFMYKGKIYQSLFEYNLKEESDKLTDITDPNKKMMKGYQNVTSSELETALQSYLKVQQLDAKKYSTELLQKFSECAIHFENKGIAMFNSRNFSAALPLFEKAVETNASLGKTDTININNAAVAAERAGNYEKAKMYYQKQIDLSSAKAMTYLLLYNLANAKKDTATAAITLKKGREIFPNDLNLITSEINYYQRKGQINKAIESVKLAINQKPNDPDLQHLIANLYDNLANQRNDTGTDTIKLANYEELINNAEIHYKKAIELKPSFFDALYNLGVLYNNCGYAISKGKDATNIMNQEKYAAATAKANEYFSKAASYLEKALEINGNDKGTLLALKQLYERLNQPEKLKMVNEKLKN